MNSVYYCLTALTTSLLWQQSSAAWNLGTSFHDNPLYIDSKAAHCAGNDSATCDLVSIQHHCTVQLSAKYPGISRHNFLLSNDTQTGSSADLSNQCCSTWALLQCISSQICDTCGDRKLQMINAHLIMPLRRTLESGQCSGRTADSLYCNAQQFWLFGSIFISSALAVSLIIFVIYRVRARRNEKPMYELFY